MSRWRQFREDMADLFIGAFFGTIGAFTVITLFCVCASAYGAIV